MKDPTKFVRKMYVYAFNSISVPLYDGMAPNGASGLYGVIDSSFTRRPIKSDNYFDFTVNIEIYHETREYGNSETVDAKADALLDLIIPLNSKSYLTVQGFQQNEISLQSAGNDAYNSGASMVTWRKKLSIIHLLSEL